MLEFALDTSEWGRVLLARPIPVGDDPWGCLAPVRGTPWGDLIPIIPGDIMSHALHGYATPMMRLIGPPPYALLKKVPGIYRDCVVFKDCLMHNKNHCHPGPKLPDCFVPAGVPVDAREMVTQIAMAWRSGRYVVVVEGVEFSF